MRGDSACDIVRRDRERSGMPTSEEELPEVRIVLADRHQLFCDAIRKALERKPGFRIVGLVHDVGHLVAETQHHQPAVVVAIAPSRRDEGVVTARLVRELGPRARVVLVGADDLAMLASAFDAGAYGYLTQACSFSDFVQALRKVSEGQICVSECMMGAALDYFTTRSASHRWRSRLAERERRKRAGRPALTLVGGEKSGDSTAVALGAATARCERGESTTTARVRSPGVLRAVADPE